jgi:UDP-GlcNAc:undecaprenyl-phosphate GlcNAc-1-phosphate transferase
VRLRVLPGAPFLRQVANAAINTTLVLVSFYATYAFRYGTDGVFREPSFIASLPIVFGAKMAALGFFRTYRSVWRYTDSRDLAALAAASTVGSVAAVLIVLFVYQFQGFSRSLFVLDWLLFTSLLAASRLSLRALSEMLRPRPAEATRVLIYGAGDAGVSLSQELRRNQALGRTAIGFIDDDLLKQRTRIQGLPVLGGIDQLTTLLSSSNVEEVILAASDLPNERVEHVRATCAAVNVAVNRFGMSVTVDPSAEPVGSVH